MTTELEGDLAELAATLRGSSVAVRSARGAGSGSGVVWPGGKIVTNAHVARTTKVEIELADGRRLPGRVERRDEQRDLACVLVEDADLRAAQYRDPADLRVGELVVAFGHPLGVPNVLSAGIVFAPHRAGRDRFVRADLKLEPGNSGGALADTAGRVLGINSMVADGLALAIPADEVRRFMDGSGVERPRLGVRLARVELAGRVSGYAVLATEPASPAERAGIIVGDILLTSDVGSLGGARSISLLRGGVEITVTIADPQSEAAAAA